MIETTYVGIGRRPKPAIERMMERVTKTADGCWEYARDSRSGESYRQISIRVDRKAVLIYAHRFSYEHYVGPIPGGMQLDHLCRNRMCVNPAHLEPVTPKVNTRRARALITECPSGHPYNEDNTRVQPDGRRYCRECKRIRGLARYRGKRRRTES